MLFITYIKITLITSITPIITSFGINSKLEKLFETKRGLGFLWNDHHPFGMMMPGREYQAQPSRFGFNGKENDNDVKGFGNQQDYGMRIYDARVGRFLSVDPMTKDFPWYSPYQFAGNNPIAAKDLDGLEPQEAITLTEEQTGRTTLKVSWKQGNGKVVQMVNRQAMSRSVLVRMAKSTSLLGLIFEVVTSPTTSPQDAVNIDGYPRVVGTPNEDKFWDMWVGPGRNFPLPPTDPSKVPQWLVNYWPEGMPINLPNPTTVPKVETKPIDDDDNDKDYITLYRGVSDEMDPRVLYTLAQMGIAYPKGLLPGHEPQDNPDLHTLGYNSDNSIYTSWTIYKSVADKFARGKSGNANGIILSKRFKLSQLKESTISKEHFEEEGEYLVPGVVTGASKENISKKKNP